MDSVKDFVVSLARNPKEAIRSALTTAVTVAAVLAFAGQYVSVPAEAVALVATVTTVLRTLLAAVDAGNTTFGRTN